MAHHHHHQVNIRCTISSSNSITISRSASRSGPSRWTISARRWCSSRAVASRGTTRATGITRLHHLRRRWASEVHHRVHSLERTVIIRLNRSTKTRCATRLIIFWRLIRVIIIIIRLGLNLPRITFGMELHENVNLKSWGSKPYKLEPVFEFSTIGLFCTKSNSINQKLSRIPFFWHRRNQPLGHTNA